MCTAFLKVRAINSTAEKAQWATEIWARCQKQLPHVADKKNQQERLLWGTTALDFKFSGTDWTGIAEKYLNITDPAFCEGGRRQLPSLFF